MVREQSPSQQIRRTRDYRRVVTGLGARIRELRLAQGLTLEVAAERGGMDLKHWQKIEAGTLNVTIATLVRIARGLGVEVADLFSAASSAEREPSRVR